MSQTLSTEEILHRMKVHVDACNSATQGPTAAPPGSAASFFPVQSGTTSAATPGFGRTRDFFPLRFEIETAIEGTRQVGQLNPRKPGLRNDAIQFIKRMMRRSLAWYTRPIHYFQGAVIRALQQSLVALQEQDGSLRAVSDEVARHSGAIAQATEQSGAIRAELAVLRGTVTSELEDKVAALVDDNAELHREVVILRDTSVRSDILERRLSVMAAELGANQAKDLDAALEPYSLRSAVVSDELSWQRAEISQLQAELHQIKIDSRLRERDWRRFFHDIQAGTLPANPQAAAVVRQALPAQRHGSEFDYFRFEEIHRGDETLIAERQKEYLEFFRDRDNVVDVGCGRGEFLELLRANGIKARGVEIGTDQYLLCREKALDVVQQDLFDFLESVQDGSLGGLFSAQVIEHLAAEDQLRFVSLAHRKTCAGSPVIFETINIQSLFALSRNFFLDPTHVRPVHPEMLKFAMQSAKFRDVELRYSSPFRERWIPPLKSYGDTASTAEFNRALEQLNDLVYGYLDYAAIGWH